MWEERLLPLLHKGWVLGKRLLLLLHCGRQCERGLPLLQMA